VSAQDSGRPGPRDFEGLWRIGRAIGGVGSGAYGAGLVVAVLIVAPQIAPGIHALGDVSTALTRASVAMEESAKASARTETSCGQAAAACAPCAGLAAEVRELRERMPAPRR
jgi:hypothetical protein